MIHPSIMREGEREKGRKGERGERGEFGCLGAKSLTQFHGIINERSI